VRRERVARGLTQEKLAELMDVNSRTVQKIEAGKLNILLTTILRLQKALGCPWDSLMRRRASGGRPMRQAGRPHCLYDGDGS